MRYLEVTEKVKRAKSVGEGALLLLFFSTLLASCHWPDFADKDEASPPVSISISDYSSHLNCISESVCHRTHIISMLECVIRPW